MAPASQEVAGERRSGLQVVETVTHLWWRETRRRAPCGAGRRCSTTNRRHGSSRVRGAAICFQPPQHVLPDWAPQVPVRIHRLMFSVSLAPSVVAALSCGGKVVTASESVVTDASADDGGGVDSSGDVAKAGETGGSGESGDGASPAANSSLPAVGWYNLSAEAGIGCTSAADCPGGDACCATSPTTTLCKTPPCFVAQLCASNMECESPMTCGPIPAAPSSPVMICSQPRSIVVDECALTCKGCCDSSGICNALGHLDTACGIGGSECVDCTIVGAVCNAYRRCAANVQ